jgi:hypothetical protein
MSQWADLPTPRAREKAKEKFAALEAQIEQLRQQQQDAASLVEQHWKEMHDLRLAIADAKWAMRSEKGATALRQRAEALRGILCRIECEFVVSGKAGGKGSPRSRLVAVNFIPIAGNTTRVEVEETFPGVGV